MPDHSNPRVLVIVENLTVPVDRRVWQEVTSLRDAGYTVSVICPVGPSHTARYELLDGIHVFRHPLPIEARGPLGYALEYSWALAWELALSIKVKSKVGFDVVQACNPPDAIFLVAGVWKLLFGTPFIFDHHDINPELYEAKFAKRGFFHRLLCLLERLTFKVADVSIATNETFRRIAIERGGMEPDRVHVVRSIPDVARFRRTEPEPALRKGRRHVVGYVGIMGAQDGIDLLVEAMADLVHGTAERPGRDDVQCVIVGSGTELEKLQRLAVTRGVGEHVTFTGFRSGEALMRALSTFDIGVIPDPKNTYNDKISMNKVFEYMTLGIPFVGFDLVEGRAIGGEAGLYADESTARALAGGVRTLLDDPDLRRHKAEIGAARAAKLLRWESERAHLLAAYEQALALAPAGRRAPEPGAA